MIEDDIYRTSSQFRVWSYTEQSLQSLRVTTNAIASDRVRAAIRRAREARQSATPSATGTPQPGSDVESKASDEKPIDCLTPEEELVFVRYYCESLLELGDEYKPPLPTTVRVSWNHTNAEKKQYLTACSSTRLPQFNTFAGSI
jgi:cyclin H